MPLRNDGSSRIPVSRMPYDPNQSLIKKMTSRVTNLIGWHSSSQSIDSQNCDSVSSSADDESNSPSAKRIRVDHSATLCMSSASKSINDVCSPIQPVNDINVLGATTRSRCIISSTPAILHSEEKITRNVSNRSNSLIPPKPIAVPSSSVETSVDHRSSLKLLDSFDNNESVNSILPQLNIHQRHNVTVPAVSKEVSHQSLNHDRSKLSGTFSTTNTRGLSFNVDVFSGSNKRLSMSVCENRNGSLSPFYSARTMYGGASALLPYGNQSIGRMRAASTSKLNLFAPRNRISIQPVSKPPKTDDQETMSATARRILDTIEKYCSPIIDAKRIPVNGSSKVSECNSVIQPSSKGVKRKLPTLSQITPNTSDLLRIKRKEQMDDSVSKARQIKSSVPESSIVADDSDSSDSVELDYSILNEDIKTPSSRKYVSKVRRKQETKIDSNIPVTPVKLPNAVLKITNLPKFDITDTFTFSKPLLIENLEDNVTETNSGRTLNKETRVSKSTPPSASVSVTFNVTKKSIKEATNSSLSFDAADKKCVVTPGLAKGESPKPTINPFLSTSLNLNNSQSVKTAPWTCRVCSLESTTEQCSSCTNTREANLKPAQVQKSVESKNPLIGNSHLPTISEKGKSTETQLKETPTKVSTVDSGNQSSCTTTQLSSNPLTSQHNDLWKSTPKAAPGSWNCDTCLVKNQPSISECVACGTPKDPSLTNSKVTDSAFPASKYSFGVVDKTQPSSSGLFDIKQTSSFSSNAFSSSNNNTNVFNSAFLFGFNNTSEANVSISPNLSTTSTSSFKFGSMTADFNKATVMSPFTFGQSKVNSEVLTSSTSKNVLNFASDETDNSTEEKCKPIEHDNGSNVFNNLPGATSNSKNPLLKPAVKVNNEEPPEFKSLNTLPSKTVNGDDLRISNVFNNIGSSVKESQKKDSTFTSFGATTSVSIFNSNGFGKSENSSTTASPIPTNSLFGSNFTSAPKLTNETQSIFNSSNVIATSDDNKPSIFSSTNSFASPTNSRVKNSIFTNFNSDSHGSRKTESQSFNKITFDSTPNVTFGNNNSTTNNNSCQIQQPGNIFTLNGPKAETSSPKEFVFGNTTSSTTNSNNFSNSTFGNVGSTTFGAPIQPPTNSITNDSSQPGNSLFVSGNPVKSSTFEMSSTNNTGSIFGNNMFGAQQPVQPVKKSGGFNFGNNASSFGAQSSFTNSTSENQNQNPMNIKSPSGVLFCSGITNSQNTQGHNFNLNVPPNFNFSGGNAFTSFSAQPTTNNAPVSAIPGRKLRKAARRLK